MRREIDVKKSIEYMNAELMVESHAMNTDQSFDNALIDFKEEDFNRCFEDTHFTDKLFKTVKKYYNNYKMRLELKKKIISYFAIRTRQFMITDYNLTNIDVRNKLKQSNYPNGVYTRTQFDQDWKNDNFSGVIDAIINNYMRQSLQEYQCYFMNEALKNNGKIPKDIVIDSIDSPISYYVGELVPYELETV